MKANIVEFPDRKVVQVEAASWLIQLDGDGEPSPEMLASLSEWLARSPVHRQELNDLATTWRQLNVLTELSVPLGRIDSGKTSFAVRLARCGGAIVRARMVLTSLAFLVALYAVFAAWAPFKGYLDSNGTFATRIGEQRLIVLTDGSVIRLNTNSEIRVDFSRQFRDIRLVRGEAEFSVARIPDRPFRVYARDERVQAIGTAFTVYMRSDTIDVMVTEGEVALATRREGPSVSSALAVQAPAAIKPDAIAYVETLTALKAGQSARMNLEQNAADVLLGAIEVEVIDEPEDMDRRLAWREGLLIFDGDPLEEVVREISRYTTVAIEIGDPEIGATRIGGQFPVGETDAMLDVLESSFGFRITRFGTSRVLISAAAN